MGYTIKAIVYLLGILLLCFILSAYMGNPGPFFVLIAIIVLLILCFALGILVKLLHISVCLLHRAFYGYDPRDENYFQGINVTDIASIVFKKIETIKYKYSTHSESCNLECELKLKNGTIIHVTDTDLYFARRLWFAISKEIVDRMTLEAQNEITERIEKRMIQNGIPVVREAAFRAYRNSKDKPSAE